MNVHLLQREALVPDAEDEQLLLGDLDREALHLLGYGGLHEQRVETRRRCALRQTLVDLDVHPFTPASVAAYKRSCEQTGHRRLAEAASWGCGLSMLASIGAMPVLVLTALLGLASVTFYAALTIVIGTALACACGMIQSRYGRERKWTMKALSTYTEPVPEFALQTAVDIKQAHPEVEFHVCTLEENRLVVDPFLVMRVQDEGQARDYYVEVWNESKFDGRRVA